MPENDTVSAVSERFKALFGQAGLIALLEGCWQVLGEDIIQQTRTFCAQDLAQRLAAHGDEALHADDFERELDYTRRKFLGPFDAGLDAEMVGRGYRFAAAGGRRGRLPRRAHREL